MLRVRSAVLLLVALLPLGLLALDAPPHPTLLVAEHRGQRVPIVAVEKETAIALVDGQRKKLSSRAALQTIRVSDYAAGRAKLVIGRLSNLQIVTASSEIDGEKVVGTPGATVGGYVEFSATITADRDLKDCYIALVSFATGFESGRTEKPESQIRLRQLPDLAAGRATEVKFGTEPFLGDSRKQTVFVLLFSGAEEVYTGPNAMAWRYFQRREHVLHRAAVNTWLERHRGKDMPIAPALQISPFFVSAVELPKQIEAAIDIDANGDVSAVTLPDGLPTAAREPLTTTLRAWRFYPKLVGGVPTPARVRVPLQF